MRSAALSEEDLHAVLKRECQPFSVLGPSIDPFGSSFGKASLGRRGDLWPRSVSGELVPILQLNLTMAHHVPPALADIALLQVFVDIGPGLSLSGRTYNEQEAGAQLPFVVRSFPVLEGLEPVEIPEFLSPLKPTAITWDVPVPDYANRHMAAAVVDTDTNDVQGWEWAEQVHRSKLGGWPATMRATPWWDREDPLGVFEPVIQIAQEPESGWDFPGVVLIGRGISDKSLWALDVQQD